MNKIIVIFILIITVNTFAQQKKTKKCVKKELQKLFKLVKNNDIHNLAKHFVYRGGDSTRKWKDVLNSNNKKELEYIIAIRNKINNALQNQYKIVNFIEDKQKNRNWYVLEIEINKKSAFFAFIEINGNYVIGDIDNLKAIMNNKKTITVPVVVKNRTNKNGEITSEYFIRRSIKDYFINFNESIVSRLDFEKSYNKKTGFVKTMKLEIEILKFKEEDIKNSNPLDIMDEYVIIYKLY